MRRVPVSREGVYSLVAFLLRHKAKASPRAVRFALTPGKPVKIVLEPWETVFDTTGEAFKGRRASVMRVWGRRRLMTIKRMLPFVVSCSKSCATWPIRISEALISVPGATPAA